MPLCLDLGSKLIVVFGGGSVGERKARLFSEYAHVRVVSKAFTEALLQMERDGRVELVFTDLSGGFEPHLKGAFIAIPATSDSTLNARIERRATELGVLVNKVDGVGDVAVPSIIRRDSITLAISTGSPALSRYMRLKLERELAENYTGMARLLGQIREELKRTVPDQRARARIVWRILSDQEVWRLLDESYEKAYMRAREDAGKDERDSLDAGDPSQGLH
jgi:precorrin-2 dehydrogenase/sirohydrochlorin ferrochelatase